jgi:cell division septation protein DedD
MKNEEKMTPKNQKAAMTEKKVIPGSGEESIPPGLSNQDKGARSISDPEGTEKNTPTQSADSSNKKVVYTIQAAAFKHQKDAYALRQTLEAKGYKVSVKKETNPKGVVLFKVRVGEFEQKKDASVFALKLKRTDGLNAFAVRKN